MCYVNLHGIDRSSEPTLVETIRVGMALDENYSFTSELEVRHDKIAMWRNSHEIAYLESSVGKPGEQLQSSPLREELRARHPISQHDGPSGSKHGGHNPYWRLWYGVFGNWPEPLKTQRDPVAHFKSVSKLYKSKS